MTISEILKAKKEGRKLTMLTAYDAPTAEVVAAAGVDMLLVGDSLGMVVLGYPSTLPVTMDEMIHHAKAVRRGAPKSFIIGDLPLKGVQQGPRQALLSAKRFIEEAGLDAVKLEWNADAFETTDLLVQNNVPVMAHLGLTPQSAGKGFRVQAQSAAEAAELVARAKEWESHKIFSLLLECVPSEVAATVTKKLRVPVIGIGAGSSCDGQVLVFHDLVGVFSKFLPKHVKRYAKLEPLMRGAVERYIKEVRAKKFPDSAHCFAMERHEHSKFKKSINS